jgi:hypothetical protein
VVLPVTRAAGSAFAPSAALLADFTAGRVGWRQFERRYTDEMRSRYRDDLQLWVDLVEQAAFDVGDVILVCDECGPEQPGTCEAFARCHRRLLKEFLFAVATDRGLMIDPDTDALDRTLLEVRRKAVLAAAGLPLACPVCARPADAALAIRGRDGYGYGSEACREEDVARWKAQAWSADSGRRGATKKPRTNLAARPRLLARPGDLAIKRTCRDSPTRPCARSTVLGDLRLA